MKNHTEFKYSTFAGLMAYVICLSSCETLVEEALKQEASYAYEIDNQTDWELEVTVELSGLIIGDRNLTEIIPPHSSKTIWKVDFEESCPVVDFEEGELSVFQQLSITIDGYTIVSGPANAAQWTYRKESSCRAVYTSTVELPDYWLPLPR